MKMLIIITIASLLILATPLVAKAESESSNYSLADPNCISMECIKERLRLICESESELMPKPEHLDCENILRCTLNAIGEQEAMRCGKGYSL